jgi:hypothetical protein
MPRRPAGKTTVGETARDSRALQRALAAGVDVPEEVRTEPSLMRKWIAGEDPAVLAQQLAAARVTMASRRKMR